MIDALTAPFRFLARQLLAMFWPDTYNRIGQRTETIIRQVLRACLDELGRLDYTQVEFNEVLDRKLSELETQRREDQTTLLRFTMLWGFGGKDAFWAYLYPEVVLAWSRMVSGK